MDIDKFPDLAELLEIKHVPVTFLINKGELVDQLGGVPRDKSKILNFFQKAKNLGSS